ncbi:hypothetical protein EYF80_028347 [Liparis tanakae]|uniref:Uncharacterized protein n=1 Tax=Liparis tanakae TaxID=230148 RepID=A0A4Z2H6E5_9TELE|nr:hypothetical protein EYF80_028347 [Liparis tanakae]
MELPRRLNWIRNRPWRPHVRRRKFNIGSQQFKEEAALRLKGEDIEQHSDTDEQVSEDEDNVEYHPEDTDTSDESDEEVTGGEAAPAERFKSKNATHLLAPGACAATVQEVELHPRRPHIASAHSEAGEDSPVELLGVHVGQDVALAVSSTSVLMLTIRDKWTGRRRWLMWSSASAARCLSPPGEATPHGDISVVPVCSGCIAAIVSCPPCTLGRRQKAKE